MGTIVAVHRGATVTVRYDDGSEARVDLGGAVKDAEICEDTALLPSPLPSPASSFSEIPAFSPSSSFSSSSRSRGRGKTRRNGSRDFSAMGGGGGGETDASGKSVGGGRGRARVIGADGRVLGEDEGAALTVGRAGALLDTAPEKLVGLTYQEFHRPYGGWRETVVTEVTEARVGDYATGDNEGLNARWPQGVTVEQVYPAADDDGREVELAFSSRRRMGALLSRLRVWDKQRKDLTAAESGAVRGGGDGAGLTNDVRTPVVVVSCDAI